MNPKKNGPLGRVMLLTVLIIAVVVSLRHHDWSTSSLETRSVTQTAWFPPTDTPGAGGASPTPVPTFPPLLIKVFATGAATDATPWPDETDQTLLSDPDFLPPSAAPTP